MWPDDCFIYEGVLTPRDGYFKNLITKYHADVLVHIDRWIPCLVANGSETMDRIEPVVAVPATSTDREILEALQKDAVDRETIYLEEQLKNQALKDRVDAINSLAN